MFRVYQKPLKTAPKGEKKKSVLLQLYQDGKNKNYEFLRYTMSDYEQKKKK